MEQRTDRLESANTQGQFFVRMGRNFLSILRGLEDPLELIFRNVMMEKHYQEVCDEITSCRILPDYLGALSHKYPQLKVLEVGTGTGSFTEHVLRALCTETGALRLSRYDYTDISEAFFERAREKLTAYMPKISYGMLKIHTSKAMNQRAMISWYLPGCCMPAET
ncbi:hypothetical protein F4821DRAFT_94313 [Hypoxylon rubiginosum]|uniref:Uncharacterized protein n=1 Tax=Hypoxylon rubiginosum TaxID=110542 RepID=A0ACC0D6U1_9PEZI|nr:hypothetical protein F4821DRAFT_94313 [Hypoxylon rubiginosum]